MRKLILVLFAVLLMAPCGVFAASNPVRTLHDLPSHWEGTAGDLLSKSSAQLNIDKINKVIREDNRDGFSAVYEVTASMTLGSRELAIKQITLSQYATSQNTYELVFVTNDEFVITLVASVVYDEASNTFTLRDHIDNGQRRFVFQAVAKK